MTDLASQINHTVLAALAPRVAVSKIKNQQSIIASFGPLLPDFLKRFQLTTSLRIVHFLAQLAHESDGFCAIEEYASGAAYEGRADLGNTQPGDGKRYKGRSPIQLTGRANYRAFTKWIRGYVPDAPDFEAKPELVATWPWAAWAVFYFWSTRSLNDLADKDDLVGVTKRINGGTNGLADRAAYLAKAKDIVAELQADNLSSNPGDVVLRRGMRGLAVADLQRALRGAGFYHLSIDSIFGPGTEQAVIAFQREYRLRADGLVGAKTFAQLKRFMPEVAA
ncbi:peptidoglycan-binding protein [Brucella anthropi]|uniref:peptidoglycan-binding protein n=1 Tax=Brucella anthropi TaxID=529 RepID=UPI00244C0B56|nr:peptidoglycan-binding protein [Brucella anthropi]MDG9793759.1 peptidoglycan-binding protein [Brucella anthropi]MDH0583644.1 peptidoglycan-binding protein [Brucella anthropi]MDH0820170.1 peptidoglycan-binding protein [Brucella anthropi]MDH2087001.1 peptidoglycan-binding protein [Brucella anthropi]